MPFKKTTMRHHQLFHRHQHLHRVHNPNRRTSSKVMKTKSFSVVMASITKSIKKYQGRFIKFLSKLSGSGPNKHQSFGSPKREVDEESNTNSLQQQQTIVLEEKRHLLPPLVDPTKKRTIVLDLDETLIHSKTEPAPLNYDFIIKPIFNGVPMNFYVLKRPGVDEFLEAISTKYEIVVFTAGMEPYASSLLDVLDPKGLISHRLYRDSCSQLTKTRYVKDLSRLGRELSNVVIVDDNPRSYTFQQGNGIPIKKFFNDVEDKELGKLLEFFEKDCDDFEDMRDAVKQCFGGAAATGKLDRRSWINHNHHNSRNFDRS